jgi:diguanylate cyclase (GGDEF) domain
MLDSGSLLIATAISGLCLSMTTLAFGARRGSFILTWSAGVAIIVVHILMFWLHARDGMLLAGILACTLLPIGAACLYAAARAYAQPVRPLRIVAGISVPYVAVAAPLYAFGYDGISLILQNFLTSTLCVLVGRVYWLHRAEAPRSLSALAGLYGLLAFTFLLCGLVLLNGQQWSLGTAPSNWAEDLNVVVSVLAMTGIGALTLAIDQSRLANRHRTEALTDPLTGLMNRRGLDELHTGRLGARKAVVIFDLDHFKQINDTYGHAIGDEVLRGFADVIRRNTRISDHTIRLGGEEFAVIMNEVMPDQARKVAERIAADFAHERFTPAGMPAFSCTVSAGMAFGDAAAPSLGDVLRRADGALYVAKNSGRNRVETGEWRLVG